MHYILLLFILFVSLFFEPLKAESKDYRSGLNDETICLYQTAVNEKKFGIRDDLLSTIAIVETGRYNPKHPLGVNPWPWTVTSVKGSKYHKNKLEAVAEVKKLLREGINSVDVGCMQINLKFHGKAFKSVEEALDPAKNTAYAAKYLKELYQVSNSWGKAATRYHSGNPEKSAKYEKKLIKAWRNIRDKSQNITVTNLSKPNSVKDFYHKNASQNVSLHNKSQNIKNNSDDVKTATHNWRKQKIAEYLHKKRLQNNIRISDI